MTAVGVAAPRTFIRPAASRYASTAAVALVLVGFAALLAWNARQYDWLRGYDAWASSEYVRVVRDEGRMPTEAETTVWHNPPLFFALAGGIEKAADRVGGFDDPHEAVEVVSIFSGVAIVLFAFLIARELFPRSRAAPLAALGLAATTPVLVRASILYHPEPLATALAAGGTYVLVRALARRTETMETGALAGVLLGLANLTRTWALAVLAAAVVATAARAMRDRRAVPMVAALAAAAAALVVPWLAFKTVEHGSPLAYSQPVAEQWRAEGRPREFYLGFPAEAAFGSPYSPHYANQLLPVVYTDWWGDYWRYYDVPADQASASAELPDPYDRDRVIQSYVGLLPTALALAGFVALCATAVRTRSAPLLAVLGAFGLLAVSFVGFLVEYPKQDGDNIKALYLLNAVIPVAVCGGWTLGWLARRGRLVFAAVLLLLVDLAYLDIRFLVLPAADG